MLDFQLLEIPHDQLSLDYTLPSGQAFRWRKSPDGCWTGVTRNTVVRIRRTPEGFEWQTYPEPRDFDLIRDYFRLDDDIPTIYAALAAADEHLAAVIDRFKGLRLLRQDPTETLLSFICSAANSIPRISASIEALSAIRGEHIVTLEGIDYHAFPTLPALAAADASQLEKTAGLGFRGPALKNVARQILDRPEGWLESLRGKSYETAREEPLAIRGVGRKIADCVCLFSLDKNEAVPVDTHVRQLAARLYLPDLKTKSITAASYDRIANSFRERFGAYAGWAQQFLYYEDLLRSYRPGARRGLE
ncbi:MAG: DNA glycosylase [Armatimonadota bacterium]|nr:DNA glycosylase [Armatimonadota bacterium]